jgi:hypothetical protein
MAEFGDGLLLHLYPGQWWYRKQHAVNVALTNVALTNVALTNVALTNVALTNVTDDASRWHG